VIHFEVSCTNPLREHKHSTSVGPPHPDVSAVTRQVMAQGGNCWGCAAHKATNKKSKIVCSIVCLCRLRKNCKNLSVGKKCANKKEIVLFLVFSKRVSPAKKTGKE
jgi:hypothetical protein